MMNTALQFIQDQQAAVEAYERHFSSRFKPLPSRYGTSFLDSASYEAQYISANYDHPFSPLIEAILSSEPREVICKFYMPNYSGAVGSERTPQFAFMNNLNGFISALAYRLRMSGLNVNIELDNLANEFLGNGFIAISLPQASITLRVNITPGFEGYDLSGYNIELKSEEIPLTK